MTGPYVKGVVEMPAGRVLVFSDGSTALVVWHGGMVDALGTKGGGILGEYEARSSWSTVMEQAKYDKPGIPFADDIAANNQRACQFGLPAGYADD